MSDAPQPPIREQQEKLRESQPMAVHAARVAGMNPQQSWWSFAFMAIVPGIVLAVLGPFGSFESPLWIRLVYWVPTMASGAIMGGALFYLAERNPFLAARPVLRVGLIATIMTVAMTLVAWSAAIMIFGPGSTELSLTLVFYVWVITVVMMFVATVIYDRRLRVAAASAPEPAVTALVQTASFANRLPVRLRNAQILALEAEDHYVRVHTDSGSDLILIRFSDAITEMAGTPGARTHRSWWVARAAVKSIARDNGRLVIALNSGQTIPVSRNYAYELKDAGWLTQFP